MKKQIILLTLSLLMVSSLSALTITNETTHKIRVTVSPSSLGSCTKEISANNFRTCGIKSGATDITVKVEDYAGEEVKEVRLGLIGFEKKIYTYNDVGDVDIPVKLMYKGKKRKITKIVISNANSIIRECW